MNFSVNIHHAGYLNTSTIIYMLMVGTWIHILYLQKCFERKLLLVGPEWNGTISRRRSVPQSYLVPVHTLQQENSWELTPGDRLMEPSGIIINIIIKIIIMIIIIYKSSTQLARLPYILDTQTGTSAKYVFKQFTWWIHKLRLSSPYHQYMKHF